MNILMMTNTYDPIMGGLEKSIATFSREFRKRGHKVLIVAPEYKNAKKREFGVVRVSALQNFNHTDFSVSLPVPGLVSKLVESFYPDIVHAHHPFLMGDMGMRLAGQYRVPLVFTYHTMFEDYGGYFPLNTETGKNFTVELATGFANLSDHVIAPSESVRKILIKRGVTTPMCVIPTGVYTGRFKKGNGAAVCRALKIPKGNFVAGYAGRVSPEKNLGFLGKAVSDFLKKEKRANFLVVGTGPYMKDLKKLFRSERVMEQVRFAGVLRGQKLVDAYHAMDVFVFASQSETQGMVLTEAMAAGVPVVAVDANGVRDVVRNHINGRLLIRGNVTRFSQALSRLMYLPAKEKKEIKYGALKTAEKFSMENSVIKMLQVYERIKMRKRPVTEIEHSSWFKVMGRIKTEWDMLLNLTKAAGTAVVETAVETAKEMVKDEEEKSYKCTGHKQR